MIGLNLSETILDSGRTLYTVTWVYDEHDNPARIREWCYQSFGDPTHSAAFTYLDFEYHMWVDYIQWGEICFTDTSIANWFMLKWA